MSALLHRREFVATAFTLWIVIPGFFGLRRVMRSEVK